MRKKIVAGNWKMNKTINETLSFFDEFSKLYDELKENQVEIIIFPPYTSLSILSEKMKNYGIFVGAQNLHEKDNGAYTGEISASMIQSAGCNYVLIGHSERRQFFSESDDLLNQKLKTSLKHKINSIICVGETLSEREAGNHFSIVNKQIKFFLKDITPDQLSQVIIAYEPVWAIGTGKTASPEQANEMHCEIRNTIQNLYSNSIANNISILYGGSVNEENSRILFHQSEIDGGLVGGASLNPKSFLKIIQSANLN